MNMNISNGELIVLVNQSGTAADLVGSLDPKVQRNVVETGNRKVELLIPESLTMTETVGNNFIAKNGYVVTQLVAVKHTLYVFYSHDGYRAANRQANATLGKSFG